jgi:Fur family transcriptional regulator, ferric uptake regulator
MHLKQNEAPGARFFSLSIDRLCRYGSCIALFFVFNCKRFAIAEMKAPTQFHSSKRQDMAALTGQLRRQSRNITGPRQAILEILRKQPHPLTTKEIRAAMPADQCDLATIYRATHLLEQMGMVKRFDFGDGAARFELIGEGDDGHHHHLICKECAKVVEIEECALAKVDSRIAAANDFASVTHRLEFFGICPRCQQNDKFS